MKKYRLMAPGPTPVPEKALLRMADTVIHHRTPQFKAVLKRVHDKLKKVVRTDNPVVIFSASGTGAMEASVINMLSAGDEALVVKGGKFGERFADICEVYGVKVIPYELEWGESADPAVIKEKLGSNPGIKAVYTTLCETSTGVVNDIEAIGKVVSPTRAILVVDAISGLTAEEFRPDEYGVDLVVAGSQKGLMLPPGLAFLSVSQKARGMMESSGLPKYYFDIKAALKSYEADTTPWTSAVSLVNGLEEVMDMILAEGPDNVVKRHAHLAEATREAVKAIGLELFSERPANTVTAVKVPEGVDGKELVRKMRDEQMMTIAGGQAHLKGRIFRLAHLGYMDSYDTISVIAAIEMVLKQLGFDLKMGEGVSKAQEILINDK